MEFMKDIRKSTFPRQHIEHLEDTSILDISNLLSKVKLPIESGRAGKSFSDIINHVSEVKFLKLAGRVINLFLDKFINVDEENFP